MFNMKQYQIPQWNINKQKRYKVLSLPKRAELSFAETSMLCYALKAALRKNRFEPQRLTVSVCTILP